NRLEIIGRMYFLYAVLHKNIQKPEQVLPLLHEVKVFAEEIYKNRSILLTSYPITLSLLGKIFASIGKLEEAFSLYEQAFKLFQDIKKKDVDLLEDEIEFTIEYGILVFQVESANKAITVFIKLMELIEEFEKLLEKGNERLIRVYKSAAKLFTSVVMFEESEKMYFKLLENYSTKVDDFLSNEQQIDFLFHMRNPSMSFSPSIIMLDPEQLEWKEREWKRQLIQVQKERVAVDPRCDYCITSLDLAEMYLLQGRISDAQDVLTDAVEKYNEIFKKYPGAQAIYAQYHMIFSEIFLQEGRIDDAKTLLEEGWEKFKKSSFFMDNKALFFVRTIKLIEMLIDHNLELKAEDICYELLGYISEENEFVQEQLSGIVLGIYTFLIEINSREEMLTEGYTILLTAFDYANTILETRTKQFLEKNIVPILRLLKIAQDFQEVIRQQKKKDLIKQKREKLESLLSSS
ncbi:MAG: hypothetical protein ACTSSF_13575, partial [Candidatus Heimdallarchaeaceae archaeon]